MATTVREITLTQSDIADIEERSEEIILKFRKKKVIKGVRMIFKFALSKSKLSIWNNMASTLSSRSPIIFGANDETNNEESDGYQDINLGGEDVISEYNASQTINVYFSNKPFIEDLTITVTMIIQKTTIRNWYDKYIGGGTVYVLDISPSSVDIVKDGGIIYFEITSNVDWQIEIPSTSTQINTVSPMSSSSSGTSYTTKTEITVIINANSDPTPKNEYIRIYAQEVGSKYFYVNQAASSSTHTLTVSPLSISVSSGETSTTLTVTSDTTWTFSSGDTSWCTVSLSTSTTILVSLTANTGLDRSTTVTVKTTDNSIIRTIPINQSGSSSSSLSINPTSTSFYAPSDFHIFTITTESSWTISIPAGDESWLSLDYTSGTGNKTIKITTVDNTSFNNRESNLTITSGSETQTFHVLQYQNIIWFVSNESLVLSSSASSATLEVDSHSNSSSNNYPFNIFISDSPDWLSIEPSGTLTGDLTITVSAIANTKTSPRNAIIRLWNQYGAPSVIEVAITQVGSGSSTIMLSQTTWNVEAGSGEIFLTTIAVLAPSGWTASIPALPGEADDWCYCTKISETDLRINARTNTTGSTRGCAVVVIAGSDNATITVTQVG